MGDTNKAGYRLKALKATLLAIMAVSAQGWTVQAALPAASPSQTAAATMDPTELLVWAESLKDLGADSLRAALDQAPAKAARLATLMLEDALLARVIAIEPQLPLSATLHQALEARLSKEEQPVLALLCSEPDPRRLLKKLDWSELSGTLQQLVLWLNDWPLSTPRHDRERLERHHPVTVSVVYEIDEEGEAEPDPPDPFLDFAKLSILWIDEAVEEKNLPPVDAPSLEGSLSQGFARAELLPLARLQVARLADPRAEDAGALAAVGAIATNQSLSPRLRAEALISLGRLQHRQDPKAARTSWLAAEALMKTLNRPYWLQTLLVHEYAVAGELILARPLYRSLAQDAGNPYRLRALDEIILIEDPDLLTSLALPLKDPDPGVRAAAIRLLSLNEVPIELTAQFRTLLRDPEPEVRSAVLSALQRADREMLEALAPEIEALLQSGDPDLHWQIFNLIRRDQLESFVPMLKRLLATATPDVQAQLINILAELGHRLPVKDLLGYLDSISPELRLAAVRALSQSESQEAVPALKRLSQSTSASPGLRSEADRALLMLGTVTQLEQLMPNLVRDDMSQAVAMQLRQRFEQGTIKVKDLIPWLGHPDSRLRSQLWQSLQAIVPDGVDVSALEPQLPKALGDEPAIRAEALELLSSHSDWLSPKLLSLVRAQLQAQHQDLRQRAFHLLASAQALSLQELSALSRDEDEAIRLQAKSMLIERQPDQAQDLITPELEAFDPETADRGLANLLAQLKPDQLMSLIDTHGNDSTFQSWLLEQHRVHHLKLPSALWSRLLMGAQPSQQVFMALAQAPDPASVELLLPWLARADLQTRALIIQAIGASGRSDLAPPLEPYLSETGWVQDDNLRESVRRTVASSGRIPIALVAFAALSNLNPAKASRYLESLLASPDPGLRAEATPYLMPLQASDTARLQALMADPDPRVRAQVEQVYARVLDSPDPTLVQGFRPKALVLWLLDLQDPQAAVRLRAIAMLAHYQDSEQTPEVKAALLRLVEHGSSAEKRAALQVLSRTPDRSLIDLWLTMLGRAEQGNESDQIPYLALEALKPLLDKALWQKLYDDLLQGRELHPSHRRFLLQLLSAGKHPEHIPALFELARRRPELAPLAQANDWGNLLLEILNQADASQIDFYRSRLSVPEPPQRYLALRSLQIVASQKSDMGPELVETAQGLLQDPSPEVRQAALLSLSAFGSAEQIRPHLPELLAPGRLRSERAETLKQPRLKALSPDVRRLLPQLDREGQWRAVQLLVSWEGAAALPELQALFERFDQTPGQNSGIDRQDLLRLMSPLAGPAQIPWLKKYLSRSDLSFQIRLTLLRLGDQDQFKAVLEHLRSPDVSDRYRGIYLAREARTLSIQTELLRLLDDRSDPDGDGRIDEAAFEALYDTAIPKLLPALLRRIGAADETTREHISGILMRFTDYEDGSEAIKAEPHLLKELLPLLTVPDKETRAKSIEVIGILGRPEAISALAALLEADDTTLQALVLDALADIAHPNAVPHLRAFFSRAPASLRDQTQALISQLEGN